MEPHTTTALNRAMTAHGRAFLGGHTGGRTFSHDLHLHLANGYVYSRPDAFILARPVDSTATPARISDPRITFPDEFSDTWFIYLAAIDRDEFSLTQATIFLPAIKSYIAWARRGMLHFAPATSFLDRIARHQHHHRQQCSAASSAPSSRSSPSS